MKRAVSQLALLVLLLALGAAGTVVALVAQQPEEAGPPQFTTIPIQDRMRAVTLENGHIIFVPPVARRAILHAGDNAPGGSGGGKPGGGGGGGTPSDFNLPGGVAIVPTVCFPNSTNNYDATCGKDSYQGEPALAANSTRLVGAHNDIYPGACSATAPNGSFGDCGLSAAVSTSGTTWSRFKLSRQWGGHDFFIGFDPSVAINSLGHIFVAYGVADGGASGPNGVVVVRSIDGGASWLKSKAVVLNLSGGVFEDKYWIAADNRSSGSFKDRLYVAWDRNQGNNQILLVSTSANHGETWTAPKKINDGTSKFERVIYAFPAVAPNGNVYVLWYDYARRIIFIDKSANGGSSWGTDVAVASTNFGFSLDLGCNGGRGMTPAPQMAIDAGGNIFVAYANQPAGPGATMDVFITYSTNGGASWSTPQLVSQTIAGHQFNPAIAIDSTGRISVSYQDRRDDAANCRTHTYLSRFSFSGSVLSRDGADIKVSDADSNFDGNPNGPGDYQGLACQGTNAHPYFSDHRDANISLQTGNAGAFEVYTAIK